MTVQFLAFLRDSFRESVSGWTLQIMLALAAFFILLVASIGFHPLTLEDQLSRPLNFMTRMMRLDSHAFEQLGSPEFLVEDVSATNRSEPWKSDYSFDFVVTCPTPEDMRKAQKTNLPISLPHVYTFTRQAFQDYDKVSIENISNTNPIYAVAGTLPAIDPPVVSNQVRYRVTVTGSKVDDPLAWPHRVTVFFVWDVPFLDTTLRDGVYFIEDWVVNKIGGWVLLFIGVVVTAGFIPNMLAKGSLDLLLSKPIGRSRLFVYKYVGGLTWAFLLTLATVFGFWVVIGARSGFWTTNFLATIPILTFYFAVLYAVSATTSMFTRNALVSILVTIIAWGLFWGIGKINDSIESRQEAAAERATKKPAGANDGMAQRMLAEMEAEQPLWGVIPSSTFPALTALHAVSPRTYQIDDRLSRVIAEGVLSPYQLKKHGFDKPPRENWGEMIGVSLAFIAVCLGLSCWRFETRDH